MAAPWPGAGDNLIELWSVAVDPLVPPPLGPALTGSTGAVYSLAFSPDGHTLASGSIDGAIRLWKHANHAHPQVLEPQLS